MSDITLTINQGFELAALLPCLLVIFYLLARRPEDFYQILLPLLYFACLGSGFALPLLKLLPDFPGREWLKLPVGFLESSLPEMSFLLIMQFVKQRLPDVKYFLILAVPLIGAAPLTYLKFQYAEACLPGGACLDTGHIFIIYRVITAAFVFLLLLISIGRDISAEKTDNDNERARYWLIIALVLFNLAELGVDLAKIHHGEDERLLFIHTMIGVSFVYLVLCSVFRVYSRSFAIAPVEISFQAWKPGKNAYLLAEKALHLIENEKLYRRADFSRRFLAENLGINEATLSRVINWKFKKTFREIVNQYRISEAKTLLKETRKSITIIAFETGFKSITSFNRVFKEATGMAATEFRKSAN